jgi:hypothetical protein
MIGSVRASVLPYDVLTITQQAPFGHHLPCMQYRTHVIYVGSLYIAEMLIEVNLFLGPARK